MKLEFEEVVKRWMNTRMAEENFKMLEEIKKWQERDAKSIKETTEERIKERSAKVGGIMCRTCRVHTFYVVFSFYATLSQWIGMR